MARKTSWNGAPAVLRGQRIATPNGIVPASLHLGGGRVMRVAHIDDIGGALARDVADAGELLVLPGLVDTHVHLNEPGRAEWEGFFTGTRAAAAGGVTTLLDMPLNSIPATTKSVALERKRAAAAGQCHVDVGFLAGLVPGNAGDITQLWTEGVFGFKCFLVPSGVDEFPHMTERDLREALPIISRLRAPLLVHAELPGPIEAAESDLLESDPRAYRNYLGSRPAEAEVAAVELMLDLARDYRFPLHIVHVSAMEVLPLLRAARAEGIAVTAETCPHYLGIDAEDIPAGATAFKCAPPIRGSRNRAALWRALVDGELDFVVTDHSPCPPELKRQDSGDFFTAWGGIASLELALPVMLTELQGRSISPARLTRWLSEAPAQLAGLQRSKGRIAPGLQADFAIVDPTHAFVADPDDLHQRHPITPYAGRTFQGRVHATYLRGQLIYADGDVVGAPSGRLLQRDTRASGQVLKVGS